MRTALIGCGFVGRIHASAMKDLGQTIACVVDSDLLQAEKFALQYNAGVFTDQYSAALADDIQSVHICTPPSLHYALIKEALQAGKHVVCEKPMCLNPAEGKELVLLAQEKHLVNAVNFNVRFYDACQRAKNLIAAPAFGKTCLIHGSYLQEFHVLPGDFGWRFQPELAGPMRATTEIGSHWIDLVRFISGLEILEVSANFGNFTPERFVTNGKMEAEEKAGSQKISILSEDAAVISMRFSNGAIGSLLLSEVSHGRSNSISIEVTGTQQSVWWNSETPYQLNTGRKSFGVLTQTNAFSGGFPNTFTSFFEQVYQDIETGHPSLQPTYPTFQDGWANAAVCAAIYESAHQNSAWVRVNC